MGVAPGVHLCFTARVPNGGFISPDPKRWGSAPVPNGGFISPDPEIAPFCRGHVGDSITLGGGVGEGAHVRRRSPLLSRSCPLFGRAGFWGLGAGVGGMCVGYVGREFGSARAPELLIAD